MKAITIRLPDNLAEYIELLATANKRSQQQEIIARLEQSRTDAIVLGWLKLDRWGELDDHDDEGNLSVECPECGGEIDKDAAYIGILSSGQHIGPICAGCAISE